MKKTYILAAVCLMAFASCDNKEEINVLNDGVRMTLATDCAELITRATEPGVEALNENLIDNIHYYFFDVSNPESPTYISDGTQKIGSKNGTADFYLEGMNATNFNNIFNGGRSAVKVFVVANATTPSGSTTLAAIKSTALTLTGHGKQSSFVMTGEGTLTKNGTQSAATDEIKLTRVASKITLHLIIPNSYKDLANKEWIPQLGEVQIDFKNVEKDGLVGATIPTGTLDYVDVTRKATSTPSDFKLIPDESITYMSLDVPVYSYPRNWANGDAATPYIYVTLPWKIKDSTGDYPETYYKILLPGNSLDPNCWYDITAKLGGLGSLTKEGTVTVDLLNINVSKDWKDAIKDGNNTDANVAMPRVLAVEQNTYIIYNQNSIVIPFVSSHDLELDKTKSVYTKITRTLDSNSNKTYKIEVDNEHRTITFTHELQNNQNTKPYDYREWLGYITLKQIGGADGLEETINIIQKPALCVSNEVFGNTSYTTIFVDGQTRQTSAPDNENYYRRVNSGDVDSKGHTIWRVTISTLTGLTGYELADPRARTSTNFSGLIRNNVGYRATNMTSDQNSHLANYYPTVSGENGYISPDFIVASGQSGVSGTYLNPIGNSDNLYKDARLRCATYQEAGYPAGRWRLPTKNEIMYVQKLQKDGIINETLFYTSGNTGYCCADGKLYAGADPVSGDGSVRCVYDRWYWDNTSVPRLDESDWTKFTWGDEVISW